MLNDTGDPTVALFTSETGAWRAAGWVTTNHKDVTHCTVKMRYIKQEAKGYMCIAHKRDPNLSGPITNGDFERLERKIDAKLYAS